MPKILLVIQIAAFIHGEGKLLKRNEGSPPPFLASWTQNSSKTDDGKEAKQNKRRMLRETSEHNIRIHLDFSSKFRLKQRQAGKISKTLFLSFFFPNFLELDRFLASNPDYRELGNLSKRLMREAARFFWASLRVSFLDRFKFPALTCNGIFIPAFEGSYDLNIFVEPETEKKSYFAAVNLCGYTSLDERPVLGYYRLNFYHMGVDEFTSYLYFSIFVHELLHILAFSNSNARRFRNDARTGRRPFPKL